MGLGVDAEHLVDEAGTDVVDAVEVQFRGGEQLQARDDPARLGARVSRRSGTWVRLKSSGASSEPKAL